MCPLAQCVLWVGSTLRRWIDVMLRCRRVRVEIRVNSVRVLVNRECPLLWNMVVAGLFRRLYNAHYEAQGYTNDAVLLQKDNFVSTLCDRMQGALNCVGAGVEG
jgi:hypothetical protein